MELIHNGRAESIEPARLATVGDVLAACTGAGDHVVLSLRLDGCAIEASEHAEIAALSTHGSGKLEVESRPRSAIARDGLESAADYAQEVAAAFGHVAELLREGQIDRGKALFASCLDAAGVLLVAVQRAASALGPQAAPLAAFEPSLERAIVAMEGHLVATDWVGLADCIEFEVTAQIGTWPESIAAVRRATEETR